MLGKYSPTVREAYSADQNWFSPYTVYDPSNCTYDIDGYDMYGYNEDGVDREGNTEDFYFCGDYDEEIDDWQSFCDERYDKIVQKWSYDGFRIVRK